MCESNWPSMQPFGSGCTTSNAVDQGIWSRMVSRILKCSPCPSRVDAGMIIGATDKSFGTGMVSFWSDAVFERKPLDEFRSKSCEDCCRQVVDGFCPSTILYFKRIAKQHHFFDVFKP